MIKRKLTILLLLAISSANAQEQKRVFDKKFWTLSSIDYASSFADATASSRYIKPSSECHELNPMWGGKYPSTVRYYGQSLAITGGAMLLSYELKKHNKKWWSLPMIIDAGAHTVGTVQTLKNCQ